jgi:hypothetical protein
VFIGHFAVAFAAKKLAPRTSLGTLVLAAEWIDLIFPVLVLAGLEHAGIKEGANAFLRLDLTDYPVSHSLVAALGWSLLPGGLVLWRSKDRRAALVVAAAVFSHWVLDFVSHTPDVPLWPGGPLVGLGLWRSVAATVAVEGLMFAGGLWLYFRSTRARDRIGRWGAVGLAAFLAVIYAMNLTSPPPTDVQAFAWVGLSAWLLVLWAWWVDRRREVTTAPPPPS